VKFYFLAFIVLSFIGCAKPVGEKISKIPEASGVSYCENSNTLVVANDEGTYFEISLKGKILQKVKLGKYDLEGVVCEDEKMIFAIENKGILILDRKTGKKKKVIVDSLYQGKRVSLFDKKGGIEGITKVGNLLYLAKQSKKKKKSFIAVVKLMPYPSHIVDIIEHRIADTAGLTYHDGYLYMVSDKKDLLIKYDLQEKKVLKKITLPTGAWEGIAFDSKGYIYLADDDDGQIFKYKKKALGL